MRLTKEQIKNARENHADLKHFNTWYHFGTVKDDVGNMLDTIEALQQENNQVKYGTSPVEPYLKLQKENTNWQKRYEELNTGNSKLFKDFCEAMKEVERQKQRCQDAINDYGTAIEIIAEKTEQVKQLQAQNWVYRDVLEKLQYINPDENDCGICPYCKDYPHTNVCPVGKALAIDKVVGE
jgi:DNA repair exonuclease SbcCD ATPase subunit